MSTALHRPASPDTAHVVKKARVDVQGDKHARKREQKRVRYLQKAYEKQVAKHGEPPLAFDIRAMLGDTRVAEILRQRTEFDRVPPFNDEVDVSIERLSAHGDGLAVSPGGDRLLVVPFALPGERLRVVPYVAERLYFKARITQMIERNSDMRHDELVQCRYFGTCGGCQYQMIPYEEQLVLKQNVVRNAFRCYSGLPASDVPEVRPTMASPLQMHYRTKLTPHFDLPRTVKEAACSPGYVPDATQLPIGFDGATTGKVIDIEECPIGTPTINAAMPGARARVRESIGSYKNGATLLLRDSVMELRRDAPSEVVTDHRATVHEMVGDTKFASPAGAFFQNNRSIVPLVVEYIEQQDIFTRPHAEPQYLVDAYCGSGLFALTLAHRFERVAGVEISAPSIACAESNAGLNGVTNAQFLASNAENIFAQIQFPPQQTTVVIDPPRRGCDDAFIAQLVRLKPAHIVYVSCNVHTQARDIGSLIRSCPSYKLLSVRGFDFFPQTHHVEGICVLKNVDYV